MNHRIARAAVLLIAAVVSSTLTAAPDSYLKKASWVETLIAAREARMAGDGLVALPMFNRGDFTLMFWMNMEEPGMILTKAPENTGQRGVILIKIRPPLTPACRPVAPPCRKRKFLSVAAGDGQHLLPQTRRDARSNRLHHGVREICRPAYADASKGGRPVIPIACLLTGC